jgi:tetratricopeptide (TPR) repeat protein
MRVLAVRRVVTAAVLLSSTVSAQAAKCDLPLQAHPKMLTAGLVFNGAFKAGATPDAKAKALALTVKALTDDVSGFPAPVQPSRNFLLAQVLLVWMEQPGTGFVSPRAKIGYTANPTDNIDLTLAIDTAVTAIRTAKPECADSMKLYTNGIWSQVINKAINFTNAQEMDSAAFYARRSLVFDPKPYYAYNILANVALVKEDTAGMVEWFNKTIEVAGASADTNARKVRDATLLNLAALYSNAATSASGTQKDSLTRAAVATYQRYLVLYPNDLTTKLRIMRMSGAAMDSASAVKFADEVLGNTDGVPDAQLADAGNELTKMKFYLPGMRFFEAALKKNPYNRDALYNSAVALNNLERFAEIPPYFDRLRAIDPNNAGVLSLGRNVQQSRKLAMQTRINGGRRPRPGQTLLLNPAQQREIKVYNDSLIAYTQQIERLTPTVDVRQFSPTRAGAQFTAVVQVATDKPGGVFNIVVEFLNASGTAVATQTVPTKAIQPGNFDQVSTEGKGEGIVAFRYRVTK